MGDTVDRKTDPLFVVDPREEKLPRWAQHLLDIARRRVRDAEAREEQARLATDPAGSTMLLDMWRRHDGDSAIGLGTRAQLTAVVSDRRTQFGDPIDYVDFEVHDDVVQVHGSSQLVIMPDVSNAVTIGVRRN